MPSEEHRNESDDEAPLPEATPVLEYGKSGAYPDYWREGRRFVVTSGAQLTGCCVRCGATERLVTRRKTFTWYPHWLFVLLILAWPIALAAGVLARRTVVISYDICQGDVARQRKRMLVAVSWGVASLLFAAVAEALRWEGMIFFAMFFSAAIALIYGICGVPTLRIAGYSEGRASIKGVCGSFPAEQRDTRHWPL